MHNARTMTCHPAHLLCMALLALAAATNAPAQNIYKCTQNGQEVYTDHPCPAGQGELLHQANDTEIIDRYLRLGQDEQARRFAESRQLESLYQQRLEQRQQALDQQAQDEADRAYAAELQAEQERLQAEEQARVDEAAERARLEAENAALRQQNADYQDQLNQPVYAPPPYWAPPRPDHHDDHGGNHRPPPRDPSYQPCQQLAGGRTVC